MNAVLPSTRINVTMPKIDVALFYDIARRMGWTATISEKEAVESIDTRSDVLDRFCGKWSDDPVPADELLDEMRCHRHSNNTIENLLINEA